MRDLNGKRALITGAGQGLGRELAKVFAAAGAQVIVTDVQAERIAETVGEIHKAGHNAAGYVMDVTDPLAVSSVRERINAEHGRIHVLINNAGIVHGGEFLEVPLERHMQMYQINTTGVVNVTHAFLPDLISQRIASCVNLASASSMIGLPFAATYASSKWAVLGFTESLREELVQCGHDHVQVTAICPSYVATGMFDGVKAPMLLPILKPAPLAKQVLKAVCQRREQLLAPTMVKLIPLGKGTLPRKWFRALCSWLGVSTGMANWTGHAAEVEESKQSAFADGRRIAADWANKVASL